MTYSSIYFIYTGVHYFYYLQPETATKPPHGDSLLDWTGCYRIIFVQRIYKARPPVFLAFRVWEPAVLGMAGQIDLVR